MSDLTSFNCPSCSASLNYDGRSETIRCDYCDSTIIVPDSLKSSSARHGVMGDEVPEVGANIHDILILVQNGRKIEAIKLYRETFDVGLKEAKEAVEQLEQGQPMVISGAGIGAAAGATAASTGCGCILPFVIIAVVFVAIFAVLWQENPEQIRPIVDNLLSGDLESAAESVAVTNRAAFNDVVATTRGGDGIAPDLLMENWHYGGSEIPIFVSYTEPKGENGRRSIRWEQQVATTDESQSFNMGFDNQNIYITSGNTLYAYGRSDGELLWQLNLSDQVSRLCAHCIRAQDGVVVVFTDDNNLFAVNSRTGQQLWQARLENDNYLYVEDGQLTFAFLDGKVAILDRTEIDDSLTVVLSMYDLQSGELVRQLNPTCPDPDNFFSDDTLLRGGQVFINEETDALYFIFGSGMVDQLCVQQWDPAAGEMVWSNRLAVDTELPFGLSSGITTPETRMPYFVMTEDSLVLAAETAVSNSGIIQIDLSNGETIFELNDPDYELLPLGLQNDVIVASAKRMRGSDQFAVWGIDRETAVTKWQQILQAEYLYELDPFDDRWSYYVAPDGVVLLQLLTDSDPAQLLVQKVALNDGSLIYDETSAMHDNYSSWRGLTWTPSHAYLSIQSLYELDLEDGTVTAVWP